MTNSVSFPDSFRHRMQHQLGDEWIAFEKVHSQASPVSIRVNPAKPVESRNTDDRIPWCDDGFYLAERPVFTLDPLFHAGCYYVQEASSMFLEQALRQHLPTGPIRVLDLCAAPGGKSTHILSLINEESLLVSNEVIRSRVNILSENIQKWGHHNVVVTNNDPDDFSTMDGFFDVIVIDAPCSGEGLFRKDPGAMNEWSEDNVTICSQRQQRIIEAVWPSLKENGILIYSTCTYNDSEDESILRYIKKNFSIESLQVPRPDPGIEEIQVDGVLGYRFYPHRIRGEGFFLSVMRKTEHANAFTVKPHKSSFNTPERRIKEELQDWIKSRDEKLIQRHELIQLLPGRHADIIFTLTQRLKVVYAGTFLAQAKHNKLVPEHSFALSIELRKENFPGVELEEQQALTYLRKETFGVASPHKGFALALFNGVPIGWMNLLQGRMNNLYPAEWRIRMHLK